MFNNSTPFNMPVVPAYGNNGGGFGNFGNDWVALIILAMIFGWGGFNNGWGGFGGMGGGAAQNYVLGSDFSMLSRQLSDGFNSQERKLDSISNGICSLGYDQLAQMNGINQNIMTTGFGLEKQLADCCCTTQQNIKDTNYNVATTGAGIQAAIKDCCCDNEKAIMGINYNMATQNCATLQAIDKVGDRIIDYLAADKAQALRDENQALRLAASQQAQNNYLIGQLRPAPQPAYVVANPYCNCNGGFPYPYGTTIA